MADHIWDHRYHDERDGRDIAPARTRENTKNRAVTMKTEYVSVTAATIGLMWSLLEYSKWDESQKITAVVTSMH
jgi:hypothetical protein